MTELCCNGGSGERRVSIVWTCLFPIYYQDDMESLIKLVSKDI